MSDSGYPFELADIRDECNLTAGFEVLAQMIAVDTDSYAVTPTPRSRQELDDAIGNEQAIDKRTKAFVNDSVLDDTTGGGFDDFGEFERVYEIKSGAFSDETLKDIKMRGWFRLHEEAEKVPDKFHSDITGGSSRYPPLPEFEDFVDEYLREEIASESSPGHSPR